MHQAYSEFFSKEVLTTGYIKAYRNMGLNGKANRWIHSTCSILPKGHDGKNNMPFEGITSQHPLSGAKHKAPEVCLKKQDT